MAERKRLRQAPPERQPAPRKPISRIAPTPPPGFRSVVLPGSTVTGQRIVIMSYDLPRWQLPDSLTAAERDVVERVLNGDSQQQIADRRNVARRTIANQLASAFAKLGVSSRTELAAKLKRGTDDTESS